MAQEFSWNTEQLVSSVNFFCSGKVALVCQYRHICRLSSMPLWSGRQRLCTQIDLPVAILGSLLDIPNFIQTCVIKSGVFYFIQNLTLHARKYLPQQAVLQG